MNTAVSRWHVPMAPSSRLGQWTVALAGVALAGTVAAVIAFATGLVEPADSFTDKPLLTVWGIVMVASSTASVVIGALAMFRRRDRTLLVITATVVGALVATLSWQQVLEGLGWFEG